MNSRLMKYDEVKFKRFTLTEADETRVIDLDGSYIYAKLEPLEGIVNNNIAVYVNDDATGEDYVLFTDELVLDDIRIRSMKVKLLSKQADSYNLQLTLKR